MEIKFGELDNRWEQYGLIEAPLIFNGKDTRYKAVIREGSLINVVGKGYQLLPNEEAVKLADMAAKMAGLVPFTEFSGTWIVRMADHVILDKDGTRVHALYAHQGHFEVNGEEMHLGVGVHNSIDGTLAFECGVFTFRHACANMVLAGTRHFQMAFDMRRTIDYVYRRHTAGLDPLKADLKGTILAVMEKANLMIEAYEALATEKATDELIQKIRKSRLSNRVLPDYVREPEVRVEDLTQWEVYNDITELIWHNAKSGMKTKTFQMDTLHRLISLTPEAR